LDVRSAAFLTAAARPVWTSQGMLRLKIGYYFNNNILFTSSVGILSHTLPS